MLLPCPPGGRPGPHPLRSQAQHRPHPCNWPGAAAAALRVCVPLLGDGQGGDEGGRGATEGEQGEIRSAVEGGEGGRGRGREGGGRGSKERRGGGRPAAVALHVS